MSVEFWFWFSFTWPEWCLSIILWSCYSRYLFYVFFFPKFYLLQIQTMFTVLTEAIYLRMRLISPLLLPVIDILYQ
jgi:hypothetical protein